MRAYAWWRCSDRWFARRGVLTAMWLWLYWGANSGISADWAARSVDSWAGNPICRKPGMPRPLCFVPDNACGIRADDNLRLAYADEIGTIICMRTTLNIDDDLVASAMRATHAPTKTAAIEMGLRELLAKAARERLAALYGSDPVAKAPARRRPDRRS